MIAIGSTAVRESVVAALCAEARARRMQYSLHYVMRLFQRSMPTREEIAYILCGDDPQIIEENEDEGRRSCLIWGIIADGRVGHVLFSYPPVPVVVTAYWPDTEPTEWDDNYRRRARS